MKVLRPPFRVLVLVVCCLVTMVGCAIERGTVYVKDGKEYGVVPGLTWRGRWWNYYQRGLSYAAGEFWSEAIADLQEAIAQRQKDQRDARTYGLHFLDYFPHRELGIVYYRLNRYADAVAELETSLRTADTAKAKFYLNRARRYQLQQSGRDTAAPRLLLSSPTAGLQTNGFTVTVAGQAADDAYVAGVTINGEALFIELAEPQLAFAQEVVLHEGSNAIAVTAVDLLGRLTRTQVTVQVDRRGPLLSLERAQVVGAPAARRALVIGTLVDHSRITRFLLAGQEVPLRPESVWAFQQEISLGTDTDSVPFEVEDAVGNVTRGHIALLPPAGSPPRHRQGKPALPRWSRWAARGLDTVLADLPLGPVAQSPALSQSELAAPEILLDEATTPQIIYDDKIYLAGEIRAASPLVAFRINGQSQLLETLPQPRQSQRLFFGVMVPLQAGENHLSVAVRDAAGGQAQHALVVTRHVQEIRQLEARLRIAVLPLELAGETSGLGEIAYDHLLAAFAQQGRFRLMERARLQDILREHRFSQTSHVDRDTAIRAGKIAAVESILFGTVAQQTPHTLEAIVHFVDVDTTQHLDSADVYGEDLELRDVKFLMQGLAWKFQQHFPIIEGVVIEREGRHVLVNRGSQHALKQFMKAVLFRDGGAVLDPVTGKPLGKRVETLGEARIVEVSDAFAQADLLQLAPARDIRKLDKFITK